MKAHDRTKDTVESVVRAMGGYPGLGWRSVGPIPSLTGRHLRVGMTVAVPAVTLTEAGPGLRLPARVENRRLRLALKAHQPVRLGPR